MARRLILMRHARQSGLAATDHERPLTAEGHRQARRVGAQLASRALVPCRALASTARRCRETWADVAEALPAAIETDFEPALYNATAGQLLDALAGTDESVETLLLLAHNPGISQLALALAGGREEERAHLQHGFSPASIAVFEIEDAWSTVSPRTARLLHFVMPEDDAERDDPSEA